MFIQASSNSTKEAEARRNGRAELKPLGISFLDDALIGIAPDDLVLLGAPSGIGKTQLCCNIALANLRAGRRVHFMALEAGEYEIERRLKYQIFSDVFFKSPPEIRQGVHLSYDRWVLGDYMRDFADIEDFTTKHFESGHRDLFTYYKQDRFTVVDLIENVLSSSRQSDLFIIDHVHYFDFDDENENRAIKEIAKAVRHLALEERKPIILVAHLRKRDRANEELVAGLDEFHGSSDLTKIATRVITIAPGGRTADGCYETFFRVPKNRLNGGTNRFIGRVMFDPRRNAYETAYKIGRAALTRKDGFEELDFNLQPEWSASRRQTP